VDEHDLGEWSTIRRYFDVAVDEALIDDVVLGNEAPK
jgi:hypothetical protein